MSLANQTLDIPLGQLKLSVDFKNNKITLTDTATSHTATISENSMSFNTGVISGEFSAGTGIFTLKYGIVTFKVAFNTNDKNGPQGQITKLDILAGKEALGQYELVIKPKWVNGGVILSGTSIYRLLNIWNFEDPYTVDLSTHPFQGEFFALNNNLAVETCGSFLSKMRAG